MSFVPLLLWYIFSQLHFFFSYHSITIHDLSNAFVWMREKQKMQNMQNLNELKSDLFECVWHMGTKKTVYDDNDDGLHYRLIKNVIHITHWHVYIVSLFRTVKFFKMKNKTEKKPLESTHQLLAWILLDIFPLFNHLNTIHSEFYNHSRVVDSTNSFFSSLSCYLHYFFPLDSDTVSYTPRVTASQLTIE